MSMTSFHTKDEATSSQGRIWNQKSKGVQPEEVLHRQLVEWPGAGCQLPGNSSLRLASIFRISFHYLLPCPFDANFPAYSCITGKCFLREAAGNNLDTSPRKPSGSLCSHSTRNVPSLIFVHSTLNAYSHSSSTQTPASPSRPCWNYATLSWEEFSPG